MQCPSDHSQLITDVRNPVARRLLTPAHTSFFDEAHHIEARTWKQIKSAFGNKPIVQFTATPYRADHQPVEGNIVYNYTVAQAQQENCFESISLLPIHDLILTSTIFHWPKPPTEN